MKRLSGNVVKKVLLISLVMTPLLSGCATKRYPMSGYMTPAEAETLTCRELYVKMTQAEGARLKILKTADVNWRSVAGFLGDLGINNAISRHDAEYVVDQRLRAINNVRSAKLCNEGQAEADALNRDVPVKTDNYVQFGPVIK